MSEAARHEEGNSASMWEQSVVRFYTSELPDADSATPTKEEKEKIIQEKLEEDGGRAVLSTSHSIAGLRTCGLGGRRGNKQKKVWKTRKSPTAAREGGWQVITALHKNPFCDATSPFFKLIKYVSRTRLESARLSARLIGTKRGAS